MDSRNGEFLAGKDIYDKMKTDNPNLDLKQMLLKWDLQVDGSVDLNPMTKVEMSNTRQLCE